MQHFHGDSTTDPARLQASATDASVFTKTPQKIFYPKNTQEVAQLLRDTLSLRTQGHGVSLAVRAGGTCMSGGSLTDSLSIQLTEYMHEVQVDPLTRTARVELGAYFQTLAHEAGQYDLMFAPYTSSKDICGIGGMIGNNASGEKSVRFGPTSDHVIRLEVVGADGTIFTTGKKPYPHQPSGSPALDRLIEKTLALAEHYGPLIHNKIGHLPKCASGYRLDKVIDPKKRWYDLTPLFVGSQGTLGVMTTATLNLVPIPVHTRLLVASVSSIEKLPEVLAIIMKHHPEGVETFDRNTYERIATFMREDVALVDHLFDDSMQLVVLIQVSEHDPQYTERMRNRCEAALRHLEGVTVTPIDDTRIGDALWRIRRASYRAFLQGNTKRFRAVPCIEDIIVPLAAFDTLIPALQKILASYHLDYGFHGHIGDGSLRIIPLFDFEHPRIAETIINVTKEVTALVIDLGGAPSADHNDGIIRTPFSEMFWGPEIYQGFLALKELYDPHGLLNPRKKVGGYESDIYGSLRRD
jgi:FAD/FMN-containing dehydrogenase